MSLNDKCYWCDDKGLYPECTNCGLTKHIVIMSKAKDTINAILFDHRKDKEQIETEKKAYVEITNLGADETCCAIMDGQEDNEDDMIEIYRPYCNNKVVLCKSLLYKTVNLLKAQDKVNKKK